MKFSHPFFCLLVLFFPSLANCETEAPAGTTWLEWRGPTRDGKFQGSQWPEELQGKINPLWRREIGEGYSGPIVTENLIITFETENREREVVRAFDRETGEPRWTHSWEAAMKVPFFADKNGSWVKSTPVCDGERLYLAGMTDVVVCLDVDSGSEIWKVDLKERYGTQVPMFGMSCSPMLDSEGLLLQAASSLIKMEKETGKEMWRTLVDESGHGDSPFSSPILTNLRGKDQIVALMRFDLAGVDPQDGKVLWKIPVEAYQGMNILTPTKVGEAIFTATYGGKSQRFDLVREGENLKVSEAWDNRIQGYMCSPVLIDGHLFFVGRNNRFNCIDAETGEIRYSSEESFGDYQSLLFQGDKILGLDTDGSLYLYRANPQSFEILDKVDISEADTWAHLAMTDNRLYLRELNAIAVYAWVP